MLRGNFLLEKKVKKNSIFSKNMKKKTFRNAFVLGYKHTIIFERSTTPNINKGKDGYKL